MDLTRELKRQLEALGLKVAPTVIGQLLILQAELLHWNRTYNLTAITDPLEALEKHLVDSLTLLPYLPQEATLLDIGSGAGFPALPLKMARPDLKIVSVDAVAKKIRFQNHMVRKCALSGFTAWHGRAEDLPAESLAQGGFDRIVARAFASLPKLLELARPCLAPGGEVIAMKGSEGERELAAASEWLPANGFRCRERVELRLTASNSIRQLLFFGL